MRLETAQQCNDTGYTTAIFWNWGEGQQCNKELYTSAMFQGWKHLSKVERQGIPQQCFKVGSSSAMS